MKIGKIQQTTLNLIDVYKEFELLEYIKGRSAKIKLKCLNCGYVFERYAHHFNNYPHVCPNCRPRGTSLKIKIEEAQKRVNDIYGFNSLQILNYKSNNSLCEVKCLKCGEIFKRVPTVLWRDRTKGCPKCHELLSRGEKAIKEILESKKIQYIQQYRFEDCKYKTYLPFDFYLPQQNVCIEYQGEQHYNKDSLFFSEDILIRDKIKKEYCLKKKISLIIIPYWDFEKINTYLNF